MPYVARAADPVKVGMTVPMTGPAAESGGFQQTGVKIALDQVNEKGVLGRPMAVTFEDDQTTNPGAVLAFSRMSGDPTMVGFLGSIRSTQVMAMAPDVLKIAKPMMIGGTDPALTHMGNRWLFRCRPNDSYSAKVIAQYGIETLGKKKWAVVHSTDAFGTGGMKAFVESLKAANLEPALVQGYTNQQADFTPGGAGGAAIGRGHPVHVFHLRDRSRRVCPPAPPVGGAHSLGRVALDHQHLGAEPRRAGLYGTYGVADYAVDASPASKAFAAKYQAMRKALPDNQSSWTYDAMTILARAINDAGSTDPEKIRTAILAIKGYEGAEGQYNFDQNGDGLHGYNVVKNDNGKIVFDKHIDFPAA